MEQINRLKVVLVERNKTGKWLADSINKDDEPFDAIVSNPPYSIKWDGDANPLLINDPRFSPAGVLAPKSKADLAFTMHMLAWLSTSGTVAIVEFPGVLYRGGAEQKNRKYLSGAKTFPILPALSIFPLLPPTITI